MRAAVSTRELGESVERAVLFATMLGAFVLRVFRLDTQSLWGDEAISVFRAAGSLAEITAEVPREGTLPPLYYYLLHFCLPLAGRSDFSVRFPSVVFGTLAVPLLYVVARRTLGRPIAIAAAALAATSPFWVYYSQETRTYAQVTAFALLALYLMLRAGLDAHWGRLALPWIGYSVAAAAAIASHYFAGFALAVAALWLVADRRRWPGVAVRCLLAQVGTLALLAPLLVYVAPSLLVTAGSVSRAGIPLSTIIPQLAVIFSVGPSVEPERAWPLAATSALLAALGLLSLPRRLAVLWGLALAAPILAIFAVSFNPYLGWARYFITASPAWYLLVAAGLATLAGGSLSPDQPTADARSRPGRDAKARTTLAAPKARGVAAPARQLGTAVRLALAVCAGLALLVGAAASLRAYYFDPSYWRYDLRSAVRQVEAGSSPDVAAVVNGPRRFPSFFHYFRGTIPAVELPSRDAGAADAAATLAGLAERYRGIWLVKYHPPEYDPDGMVERWLGEHAYKASLTWVENTTFSLYLTGDPARPRTVASLPVGRQLGDAAELTAYRAEVVRAQGADYLLVDLSWRSLRTPAEDIRIFAHLLDAGGGRVAQSDHRAVDETRPSWTWRPEETFDDRFALRLPTDASSGLSLAVGLYLPDGRRLTPLGVASPDGSLSLPLPGLDPRHPAVELRRRLGTGIALLGYDLSPTPVSSGSTLTLTLYWERVGAVARDYTIFAHLLADSSRIIAQQDSPPLGGRRPTTSWLAGEVLIDAIKLALPAGAPPGRYEVEVGMYEPETGRRLPAVSEDAGAGPADDRVLLPEAVVVGP